MRQDGVSGVNENSGEKYPMERDASELLSSDGGEPERGRVQESNASEQSRPPAGGAIDERIPVANPTRSGDEPARGMPGAMRNFPGFARSPRSIHLFFGAYLVSCVVFFKVRCLNHDSALNLVNLCSSGEISVSSYRLVSLPTYLFPYLAERFELSLVWILLAFSINVWLLHYLAAFLLLHVFRRIDLAWGVCLLVLAHLAHGSYLPHGEIYLGAIAALVIYAMVSIPRLSRRGEISLGIVLAALLALLVFFVHPVCVLFGVFLPVYYFINRGPDATLRCLVVGIGVVIAYALKSTFFLSSHEVQRLSEFGSADELVRRFAEFFSNPAEFNAFGLLFHTAFVAIGVLIVTVATWRQAIATLLSIAAALFVLGLSVARFTIDNGEVPYLWYTAFPAYFFLILPLVDGEQRRNAAYARLLPLLMLSFLLYAAFGIHYSALKSRAEEENIYIVLQRAHPDFQAFQLNSSLRTAGAMEPWNLVAKSLLATSLRYGPSGSKAIALDGRPQFLYLVNRASESRHFRVSPFEDLERIPYISVEVADLVELTYPLILERKRMGPRGIHPATFWP